MALPGRKEDAIKEKTIAITGCTGGLGREVCRYLADAGANLIMLDRNQQKAEKLEQELRDRAKNITIKRIPIQLLDMDSVKTVTRRLVALKPDYFVAIAGVYRISRFICNSGYDNIFQINFISPYYMASTLRRELPNIKIVVVGSLAHAFSKIDEHDIDFRTRKSPMKVYGNSKRFLMLALEEHTIVHPGITYTSIMTQYPPIISAMIKYPMKLMFMSPKKAALCILEGILNTAPKGYWIGPRILGIWGKPQMQRLRPIKTEEQKNVSTIAIDISSQLD